MKLRAYVSAALLLTAGMLFSGCLDADQTLVLNADGSGTLKVKYSVAEETILRVKNMLTLSDKLAESAGETPVKSPADEFLDLLFDPTEKTVRKRLESYADLGIEIENFEFRSENAKRFASFKLKFADIAKVAESDFFHVYGFSLRKNESGQYILMSQPVTREAAASSWNFSDPEVAKMVAPFMNGFNFTLNVQVPGRVLKSNALQASGNSLKWRYAFESDPYALLKLQRDQIKILFQNDQATLPVFKQPPHPEVQ